MAKHFFAVLKAAASMKGSAQIANIFSSISQLSKEDMKMINKRLSTECKSEKIRATCFCPGWVKTDTQTVDLSVEESIAPLARFILSLIEEHNGNLYSYTGDPVTIY
ncbi:hypothetical protein PMAYCL1PPCAC_32863, partial [Pristionchus mayeri]